MEKNRVFQVTGLHVEESKKAAEEESVKKLIKIHMEQAEQQAGNHHGTAFPVFYHLVTDQFAE